MWKIINIVVLSLLGLVVVSEAQIIQNGQCNENLDLEEDFDLNQFLGTWYELTRTDHPLGGDCSTIEFGQAAGVYTVYHRTVRQNFLEDYHGFASVPAGTARMTVTFPTISSSPINFLVRRTDNLNFALIYNCENIGTSQRRVYVWQLAKNQPNIPTDMVQAHLDTLMSGDFGITPNDTRQLDHSDVACYELPLIPPGQPVVLSGQCDDNITAVQNFNAGNFLGVWHQIYSYYSENVDGSCNRAQYSSEDGIVVDVVNSQIINQTLLTIEGYATVKSSDGSGRLNVTLEVAPGVLSVSELVIIATDYNQWAISYTCENINSDTKRVFSWIVSRTRTLAPAAQAQVDSVVASILDLNYAYYQSTDQSNDACFYVPEFVADEPAVYGGQCDENIAVQPDFVAADYLGLWHDIESFPTAFQFGSCANAYYSLGDVGVDVYNTQVVNETLNVINGVAIPVGDEAKLAVTFPIEGTNLTAETDYWIISTDYESYSLVYSCRNINDYQQQITMWQLSRSKALTPAAITAINNALANETVFDERYFRTMDQSREACFYYPEPVPEEPVVFPGQCSDEDIPVVANFNFQLFQGIWYEVQAYPKAFQPGGCVTQQFVVASSTVLNLVSTSVVDQLLEISTSQLTATNGTNARFTLTTTNGTHPIEFPYYIIHTDYTTHALAYSCVDLNDDFKGIYSWKLSRSRELSTGALDAINTAMEPITALREEYFEPIDQSDYGCFFFPDLAPGEPVILPGQCDSDSVIPVVTNFDAEAYLGRWRLIESYPSQFQNGFCNRAQYSLAADNQTVIVYNTEVLNQTLIESTGEAVLILDSNNQTIGKLSVTFPGNPDPFELWILDTDYENYALVYGCVNLINQQRQVFTWKMSRTTNLTAEAIEAISAVYNNVTVLNDRYNQPVDHSDAACFYFPDLDTTSTVIFPGQCNETIEVVTNFNAVEYMNLWHDIERYPAPFQDGTCGNAFYTLLDGPVVDVFNTQVLNQTLDTIRGSAVLDLVDENDTSAKLLVTFPVGGVDRLTPYWVLATDYFSYALVYSCTNLDSEYRSVSSWKLSRTKALTPDAIRDIDEVVNSIDVLDDRYYLPQDQTRDGCFYFPEPQPGVPVVFPGQCDENATVVQNFSLTAFEGIWYEIEAYPKEEEGGQCINHQFNLSSANMTFESANVIAQSLGITSGTVRSAFDDDTGRFFLDFISNGTQISIPYIIIDTDYENYALAYSCVNKDEDYRGVWSWKLSRRKELSNDSKDAIDEAISSNIVLSNIYYEPIQQTDEACFYLPDTNPGETVIFPGQCDTSIRGIENFTAFEFLGLWRTIESYPSDFQLGTCGEADYSLNDNGTIDVINTEVVDQTLSTIVGFAQLADNETGELLVTFPGAPFPVRYYVLATDYENYALVYSCVDINDQQRRVNSWKLSRTNSLTPAAETAINQVVDRINVLNERYYERVDRSYSGCFYYPEINGTDTVVFRGQCNESIPVVTDFRALDYMNLWHNIETYPAPFQDGTCGNAFYTLLDGPVVDVFNTQVLNQTLDTIRGSAILDLVDANDTSAKLLVTFPIGGLNRETPYWVLATDYFSFALVYSCTNIDDYYKSVTSWKLSRFKFLTAQALTEINDVVSSIDVLDDRYFIPDDQTREACFYFPEPQPGVPVVFPGQCDSNAIVVQNFNFTAFAGRWHEVEAYPKEEQTGQCISHEFTLNADNNLVFESYNVIAESLGITSGTVNVASTDGSARLELQFVSNGTTITIPFWIVDTDYENYALVYSCVDKDDDYRGVWSWKLSRTKELTPESIVAIDNATGDIDVLENIYYESISQSGESCFYFPDTGPGEAVIFPGQCDTNITGMANFNASRYLGLWRTIETYASEFQLGDCGDATYTLNDNGTVDVFNTEVVNETLSTINGLAEIASDDGFGKLLVTFPTAPTPLEYYILTTDYDNYALVYSCLNINSDQRRVFSWKLSRTNSLTPEAEASINEAASQVNVLNSRYYEAVNRSDASCFYYPEPNGNPVVFRGQCDGNIDVVMGFDATRYEGVWYNIESYPAPFQGGSCGTANYDLDLETLVVAVENTQVVNPDGFGPVLDVQTGTAVLALNDTSAKLLVTFEVNGVIITSDYWVLTTDYDNYALVYSCQNLNDESRQVISWKLGRARNFTAEAEEDIAAAIDRVQVLDQKYFEDGKHSEEQCFFYPDHEGGDVVLGGQCVPDDQVPAITNFNPNAFVGTWHEVARFPSDLQVGECAAADYSSGPQNSVIITQTEINNELQTANVIPGTLATDQRGVIYANITGIPFDTFFILDTDYNEFAVIYGCRNIDNDHKQVYSWKLSKSRSGLSPAANSRIDELVINNIDLFENYFSYTDQSNDACFYYPEFEEPPAVIDLPGPCDESIRGVSVFNAAEYLGRWIEIEKYPQPDQFGTCGRAYYSPGDDNVLVRNTQVFNEALEVQLGSAEVASTDGTGLLNVTFDVNGNTVIANYYVLATDYNSFALVYSCRNLDNGWRRVSSWKLSRSTSLSAQANTIMDGVISQTQGLISKYYEVTNQTEDACFYVPELNVNEAPIFRGQCDENVVGVSGFEASRYAGWWHEIERYPVDNNRGECISSNYQASGDSYLVTDTVVADGTATVDSGTVQVTADGRLRRTINGQVQDIWVLATDYETYSLLYACENVDDTNEFRRIWSAKHSKTRQLTATATEALAPVIESNRLLHNQFYQQVDQSNAACFHYPAVSGQRVILPGQCDDNIPVESNFNVEAYEGTWYQIERYPQTHEDPSSTCIGARYTQDEAAGVVTVLNWEVLNGVLLTIEGTATVVSDDGSAKLSVVLPVIDSPTNETVITSLYVLQTDYENYALAYSCSNINAFQRSVGAWKLSRERTLAPEHHTAINAYMVSREELHQPYFVSVQQDEECEEPSSGAFLRSSIIVMVICALWQILS